MRQRALDAGVFAVLPILVLGLAPGAAGDDGTVVENQDVLRIASMGRCPAADVGDEIAGDALVGPENEDALGVRRGKLAAATIRSLVGNPLRLRVGETTRDVTLAKGESYRY